MDFRRILVASAMTTAFAGVQWANAQTTTQPSDGRTGGAGPMSGNPQTDRTLSRNPGMNRDSMGRSGMGMGHGGMASDDVRQLQQALESKGHSVGMVDGVMGPRTSAALRDYQRKQGMPASGRMDDATRNSLGLSSTGSSNTTSSSGTSTPRSN